MKPLALTVKLPSNERGGVYLPIDEEVRAALGGGGRIPVRASFNGVEYRGSIVRMAGVWCLGIPKATQAAAGIQGPGDAVRVTLVRDDAPRTVEVPEDLASALRRRRGATDAFDRLSFTHRKEYVQWIEGAKKPETRKSRIAKTVEMLLEKTSGERR